MITIPKSSALKILKTKKQPKHKAESYTFWDEGLSILELRKRFPDLFWDQEWYDKEPFASRTDTPKMKTIRILEDSYGKTISQQKALLLEGEELVKVREIIMLSILLKKDNSEIPMMREGWVRCGEQAAEGNWVDADWRGGRLRFGGWDGDAEDGVGSASVRTSRET